MELSRYILKAAVSMGTEQLPHLELVIGARSSRRRFGGAGGSSSTYLAIFVSVHHLAPFSEAGILCILGGKRVPLHRVLLLVRHGMPHRSTHGGVHGKILAGTLHVARGL